MVVQKLEITIWLKNELHLSCLWDYSQLTNLSNHNFRGIIFQKFSMEMSLSHGIFFPKVFHAKALPEAVAVDRMLRRSWLRGDHHKFGRFIRKMISRSEKPGVMCQHHKLDERLHDVAIWSDFAGVWVQNFEDFKKLGPNYWEACI